MDAVNPQISRTMHSSDNQTNHNTSNTIPHLLIHTILKLQAFLQKRSNNPLAPDSQPQNHQTYLQKKKKKTQRKQKDCISASNTNQIKFIKILFHYPKTQINLLKFISSSSFTHCNTPRYFLTHQCANH